MPAITLGVAEVEERLRVLRWRLNTFSLLRVVFVALSGVLLTAAAAIGLGLHHQVLLSRGATICCVAAVAITIAASALQVQRHWLDSGAIARLADRRGALADRLTTLFDLRLHPRASRLTPLLVAQTLALSPRWRPEQIAPRLIPRSVFLLAVSLALLCASPLVAPPPPPPSAQEAKAPPDSTAAPAPEQLMQHDDATTTADSGSGSGVLQQAAARSAQGSGADAPSLPHPLPPPSDTMLSALAAKLEKALTGQFSAQKMDLPRQLGSSEHEPGKGDGAAGGDGERAQERPDSLTHTSESGLGKPRQGSDQKQEDKTESAPAQANRDTPGGRNEPGKRPPGSGADSKPEGKAPPAGSGSDPSDLMSAKGAATEIGGEGPRTFKLTITSFLQTTEQKGAPPPRSGKRVATGGSAPADNGAAPALSERQQNDDALRKAEVPAEYEDIVRRVYSARTEP